jgi:outer membrane protein OmpU
MKKMLLATSALVALMAAAPQAGAQQVSTKAPFEVTLDGWASVYMGAVPTEQNNANQRAYDIKDDFHVIIDAHSKADNGLLYGVFLRTDFDTNKVTNRNSDRANIYFQGDWGRVEAGDNQPVPYKFSHLKVAVAEWSTQAGDALGLNGNNSQNGPLQAAFLKGGATAAGAVPQNDVSLGIANLSYMGDIPVNGSNATKVTYMTPVIEGFQAGVSYSPEGTNRGGQTVNRADLNSVNSITGGGFAGLGGYTDLIESGVSYTGKYDLGIGPLGVYAVISEAYGRAKGLGPTVRVPGSLTVTQPTDLSSEYGGIRLDYAGFKGSFGLTYDGHSRLSKLGANHSDGTGWAFNLQYTVGPWIIGGYLQEARSEGSTFLAGGDFLQDQELSVAYQLAPGLLLTGSGYNFDYRDDGAILGVPKAVAGGAGLTVTNGIDVRHRYGQVYILGSSIVF